jgi:mono/diheme cytochrome c family protein
MHDWKLCAAFGLAAVACMVTSSASPAAAEKGMSDQRVAELFASTCGFCHENGGRVAGKGPKLAGTTRSDAFIVNRIKEGKEGAMPAFEGALSNRQIKSILRYIRNLKSE